MIVNVSLQCKDIALQQRENYFRPRCRALSLSTLATVVPRNRQPRESLANSSIYFPYWLTSGMLLQTVCCGTWLQALGGAQVGSARLSFLGSSFTAVTGAREEKCEHGKPLRPQLRIGTWSFLLVILLAKSNHVAKPKFQWDGKKVLHPLWGTASGHLKGRRGEEWRTFIQSTVQSSSFMPEAHGSDTRAWNAKERDSRKHKKL